MLWLFSLCTCSLQKNLNLNLKTIYIADGLTDFYFKKVLCHELVHACMYSYNVELNDYQEEVLADLVATYGHEIICITNKIFKRLTERK